MAEAKVIIGSSKTHPDIRWATGFSVSDPVVYADIGGARNLFANALEFTRAQAEASKATVLSLEDYVAKGRKLAKESIKDALVLSLHVLLQEQDVKQLHVPNDFPYEAGKLLEQLGYDIAVQAAPFYPERSVKRQDEIKAIREVVGFTEEAIGVAVEMIRDSTVQPDGALSLDEEVLTAERLKKSMATHLLAYECVALETIVAVGEQGAMPHNEGTGPLRANALIVIDIFPRSSRTGYHADISRTFIKGKPSEQQEAMHKAVFEAQEAAFRELKAGVSAKKPHEAAAKTLQAHGFRTQMTGEKREGFIHGLGHGLGLEVHEPPRLNAKAGHELVAGNVVTVEPGLYYADVGGVRLEDDVVITDGGYENLCSFPKDEWIIE